MSTQVLKLDDLAKGDLPGVSPRIGAALAEACAVCLDNQRHQNGVALSVTGAVDKSYSLQWQQITNQQRRAHFDLQDATEMGAYSIAILLAVDLTNYTVIQRSRKGTGFDYWLGYKNDPVFQNAARLEVSGILNGNAGDINARVKQKREQVKRSDATGLPAYIVVVEFSAPTSRFLEQ